MLTAIRVIRVFVGLVVAWQALSLLPVLTTWLPNLHSVTGGMWAIAFIKFLVMLSCGGIYFWLGKVKKRFDTEGEGISDSRIVIFSILAALVIGVILAIAIPALSDVKETAKTPDRPVQSDPSVPKSAAQQTGSATQPWGINDKLAQSSTPSEKLGEVDLFLLMAPPHASEVSDYNKILKAHPDAIQISESNIFRQWALTTPKTWNAIKNHDADGLIAVFSEFKSKH